MSGDDFMTQITDDAYIVDDSALVDDNYDPDDPENYADVDVMVARVTGDEPEAGQAYSLAEEIEHDEESR